MTPDEIHVSQIDELNVMTVSLRLPDELSKRLTVLARRTGRSKTYYMIEAIREHLDDLEDLYLAERRLIDIRAGKEKTIPLDEVMKRYGMED
jgi:RHH-type rel operon transcriptional repressor/antitoxin RelB